MLFSLDSFFLTPYKRVSYMRMEYLSYEVRAISHTLDKIRTFQDLHPMRVTPAVEYLTYPIKGSREEPGMPGML